ncbi:hypothetical protein Tsubulata_000009 [Turnera subulata]|uniref:Uncharacterized protein n=1 Tax=Turnera subulata TaxID=218843 RepID=A0A9Q0J7L3_9ROSI|nr:hypothetical protein Tsubulata_000009 [Turnera subulata]
MGISTPNPSATLDLATTITYASLSLTIHLLFTAANPNKWIWEILRRKLSLEALATVVVGEKPSRFRSKEILKVTRARARELP